MDASPAIIGGLLAAVYALAEVAKRRYPSGSFNATDRETLQEVKAMQEKLLEINQKYPDVFERNIKMMESVERGNQDLVHYFKWFAEKFTGEPPPPPLPRG